MYECLWLLLPLADTYLRPVQMQAQVYDMPHVWSCCENRNISMVFSPRCLFTSQGGTRVEPALLPTSTRLAVRPMTGLSQQHYQLI